MTGPVILAVGSGLAGAGKTWIATRLASGLAATGQRVLLVDAGTGPLRASALLKARCEHGLAAVVAGRITVQEAMVQVAEGGKGHSKGDCDFDLITAPPGDGPVASVAAGITALGLDYDRVVLDLPDGPHEDIGLRLATCADALLAVAADTPESLKACYAQIKLLRTRRPDCPVAVVANRVTGDASAARVHGALAHACTSWLGFQPVSAGSIARDGSIAGLLDPDSLFAGVTAIA